MLVTTDILFLTETKKSLNVLNSYKFPNDFVVFWSPHEPSRYHGVCMIVRKKYQPVNMHVTLKIPLRKDSTGIDASDGRLIGVLIHSESIAVLGIYSPNSGSRGLKNLDYRINQWDPAIGSLVQDILESYQLILLGDINVAPKKIDVSNPVTMKNYAGFSHQERESFAKLLKPILKDSWRSMHPNKPGYTWVGRNYNPNYGMRLDTILVSKGLFGQLKAVDIHPDIHLSDHIPISAEFTELYV